MSPQQISIQFEEIRFDPNLYPRTQGHDPALVQQYAQDIEQIEAAGKYISISADGVLIDGRHRYLAYKKLADGNLDFSVKAFRYETDSDLDTLRLACRLQDRGKPLTQDDRALMAKRLYDLGDRNQEQIAEALGVGQPTVSRWLARTIKEEKEMKKEIAFGLWLACATQEKISDEAGVPVGTLPSWESKFLEICQEHNLRNSHDFTPPLYNVWKRQTKTNDIDHFGNSEPQWVDNLVYLYTEPGDIVVDPFAGSGSTIDVCIDRGRRYFVSDRKPIVEREDEIRKHDLVVDGMPHIPRWKDVRLVYLDPPYWKQAEGKYSEDPTDLANMDLEQFAITLTEIVMQFARKLKKGKIALMIQPTQWNSPDRRYIDHVRDLLCSVTLPVHMRYSVPYESQQCNAQMVTWAKENKTCLVLTREIVVWEVS